MPMKFFLFFSFICICYAPSWAFADAKTVPREGVTYIRGSGQEEILPDLPYDNEVNSILTVLPSAVTKNTARASQYLEKLLDRIISAQPGITAAATWVEYTHSLLAHNDHIIRSLTRVLDRLHQTARANVKTTDDLFQMSAAKMLEDIDFSWAWSVLLPHDMLSMRGGTYQGIPAIDFTADIPDQLTDGTKWTLCSDRLCHFIATPIVMPAGDDAKAGGAARRSVMAQLTLRESPASLTLGSSVTNIRKNAVPLPQLLNSPSYPIEVTREDGRISDWSRHISGAMKFDKTFDAFVVPRADGDQSDSIDNRVYMYNQTRKTVAEITDYRRYADAYEQTALTILRSAFVAENYRQTMVECIELMKVLQDFRTVAEQAFPVSQSESPLGVPGLCARQTSSEEFQVLYIGLAEEVAVLGTAAAAKVAACESTIHQNMTDFRSVLASIQQLGDNRRQSVLATIAHQALVNMNSEK